MTNIRLLVKPLTEFVGKNAPTICALIGCAGVVGTGVLAAKETPKALKAIERAKETKGSDLTILEKTIACAPCYISAVAVGGAAIAVILMGNKISITRLATMATLYEASKSNLDKVQDKVKELFGEEGQNKVHDSIIDDELKKDSSVDFDHVERLNYGNTLFWDSVTGSYFRGDINDLRKSVNEFNQQILRSGWMSLNDWHDYLGLDWIAIGDDIGWDQDHLLEITFMSKLAANDEPCVTMEYDVIPKLDRW